MNSIGTLLGAVLLFGTTGIARAEGCVVNDPTGTPLNVRKGPSSSAAILGAYPGPPQAPQRRKGDGDGLGVGCGRRGS
jgi:hypothetical protein